MQFIEATTSGRLGEPTSPENKNGMKQQCLEQMASSQQFLKLLLIYQNFESVIQNLGSESTPSDEQLQYSRDCWKDSL